MESSLAVGPTVGRLVKKSQRQQWEFNTTAKRKREWHLFATTAEEFHPTILHTAKLYALP